jgi:hypothetical protein
LANLGPLRPAAGHDSPASIDPLITPKRLSEMVEGHQRFPGEPVRQDELLHHRGPPRS